MKWAMYSSKARELATAQMEPDREGIWLCRMIIGEGGKRCSVEHARAMIWAMINRYLLHKARHKWPDDFVDFIRGFSQPINPKWAEGGILAMRARRAGKQSGSRAACKRRANICSLTITDIPKRLRNVVRDFMRGDLPFPKKVIELEKPRISDWAAAWVKGIQKKHPQGVQIGGNWFLENRELIKGGVTVIQFDIPIDWDAKSQYYHEVDNYWGVDVDNYWGTDEED